MFTASAEIVSGRGKCKDSKLSHIASKNEMERGGWVFENIESGKHNERCKGSTWKGHRNTTGHKQKSGVYAIFKGRGTAEFKIGNCGFDNDATVELLLNDNEIGSISKMAEKYFTVFYSRNDTLHIRAVSDSQYGAIINILNIEILCGRNDVKA